MMTESYKAIPASELSATVVKALKKFWTDYLKSQDLEYEVTTDGHFTDIETLGDGWLIENLVNAGSLGDEYETLTLGELAELKDNELDLVQFDINKAGVEKLINGPVGYGLLKTPLSSQIEIIYPAKSDQPLIRGGRHRLVAFLTILKGVEGAEEMLVPVVPYRASNNEDLVQQIQLSNTTRRMTQTELTQLKLAAKAKRGQAITVYDDPSSVFEKATANAKNLTDLKQIVKIAFVSLLSQEDVVQNAGLTNNTMGDLGTKFITSLVSGLKGLHTGADKVLLAKTDRGLVFEAVCRTAVKTIVQNWTSYVQEITTYKEDKKTGEQNSECNFARLAPKTWGPMAAEVILADVGERLVALYKSEETKAKAGKAAKTAETAQAKLERELKALDQGLEMFTSKGIPIPAELEANVESERAKIMAKIEALSPVVNQQVPVTEVPEDIDSLLA